MKVPWTEHKTNEEILKMDETERKLMDTVRSRQKRWLRHILRHDSLLRIRTNTGEEGLRETKNNAFGLATEDRGRQYQLRRTRFPPRTGLDGVNEDGNMPYGRALQREAYKLL